MSLLEAPVIKMVTFVQRTLLISYSLFVFVAATIFH